MRDRRRECAPSSVGCRAPIALGGATGRSYELWCCDRVEEKESDSLIAFKLQMQTSFVQLLLRYGMAYSQGLYM